MTPIVKKTMERMAAVAGTLMGISKRIDYKTLNRYIIGMNECLSLGHILLQASQCLKEILDYQLFAFAVQDGSRLDVWIDPRIYQNSISRVIERDFGRGTAQHIHFFSNTGDAIASSINFYETNILSHAIMNAGCVARLYVLPQRRMMPHHDEILGTIVKTLKVALNNCLNIRRLENDVALDPLTGCYNRREFDRLIEHQVAGAQRHGKSMSLIMFDIDRFKQVNDTYGHQAGDTVLTQMAEAVRDTIRKEDYLVRYGGEEFVVMLPDTDLKRAMELAGRLCRILESLDLVLPDGRTIRKTASFGVASIRKNWDAQKLVKEADHLLYQAKALGRNMVMPKLDVCGSESIGLLPSNLEASYVMT